MLELDLRGGALDGDRVRIATDGKTLPTLFGFMDDREGCYLLYAVTDAFAMEAPAEGQVFVASAFFGGKLFPEALQ